jgi:uncharacterized protein with HEPN domain
VPSSNPRLTLGDIVENIDRILEYTNGMSEAAYRGDQKTIDAAERCLSRISEAAVKLGEEAERLAPGLRWSDIRGLGNHLRHGYRGISQAAIWQIIATELKPLRDSCIAAQRRLDEQEG